MKAKANAFQHTHTHTKVTQFINTNSQAHVAIMKGI